jgi:hypothetical protein
MKIGVSLQSFEYVATLTDPLKLLTADESQVEYIWIEFLKFLNVQAHNGQ